MSDVLNLYAQTVEARRKDVIAYTIDSLLRFFGDKYVSAIKRSACQDYVRLNQSMVGFQLKCRQERRARFPGILHALDP